MIVTDYITSGGIEVKAKKEPQPSRAEDHGSLSPGVNQPVHTLMEEAKGG